VSEPHTRPLDELRSADADRFGGKSAALGELLGAGIPVPGGFAVSVGAFTAMVEANPQLAAVLHSHARDLRADDTAALDRAVAAIAAAMAAAPQPSAVREEIVARYAGLATDADAAPPVAVRSSARGEDGEEATFAGQQETLLWVRGADAVCTAVRDCWASLYSAPAIAYRARMAADDDAPAMGVTVQRMVDATVSGVLFTCNPLSGDPSMVAVNASWGLGLGVVGGEVTPDDFLVSKITREVVRRTIADKHVEHVPAREAGGGTVVREVDAARRRAPCLDDAQLADLAALGRRIERHFGSHQDVEWALDGDAGGAIRVLQSRPVTAVAKPAAAAEPDAEPMSALAMVMSQFGAGTAARRP
jgi:pyruvate,water dikinase